MPAGSKRVRRRSRRSDNRRYYTVVALLAAIALVIAWQAIAYSGIMAVLAEWQFDVVGRYHPLLTYLAILVLIGLPVYLLGLLPKRSARRRAASPRRAALAALRFARILLVGAAALAIAAIAAYALIWTLPREEGMPMTVRVAANSVPPSGPATLEGEVLYDRISALDERVWFLGRSIRFVPVVAPGKGGRGSSLRYFVALPEVDAATGGTVPRAWTGTLRTGGLPGEVVPLYRYAGYRVEAPYYVLFTRPDMLTWPNRMLAVQFTIAGLIVLIGGLLQLAHARRLWRSLETPAESQSTASSDAAPEAPPGAAPGAALA